MAYKVRIEVLEDSRHVAVYVKEGHDYLRTDGALPNLTQQLLREGESPDPTFVVSSEIVQGIADALAPTASPNDSNELLATLKAQHQEDKVTIAWMQAVIAKIVGLQAAAEE